jgi:diketogulonate reductase-like aldo/keto reductase
VQNRTMFFGAGNVVPTLGVGTWNMAEHAKNRGAEIAALQTAVDLGMTVIDTAEMYGDGAAEELVGEALGHRRSEVFLVSKVLPQHATLRGTMSSCEASLRRLRTDHLDVYLLHWRGGVELEETLRGFDELIRAGKIRHWGVSNFDVDDMEELASLRSGGAPKAATNQILYNLNRRGAEFTLLPWCRGRHIPVMAYSPLDQGALIKQKALKATAQRLNATPAQVALAWVLRQDGVLAIPKAGSVAHARENRGAADLQLSPDDLRELDEAFPPPARKAPLEMI